MHGPLRDVLGFFGLLRDRRTACAAAPGRATRLSHVMPAAPALRRSPARVACASLGLVSLAMTTGCLITDPPQFKPPKHTRPFLDPTTADPPLQPVFKIDGKLGVSAPVNIEFSAFVTSQDDTGDGAFNEVQTRLYIDLGFKSPFDPLTPFRQVHGGSTLASGSLDQGGRLVSATWHLLNQDVTPGCHRATLVVSHMFDQTPCPVCEDDWSSITWQILRCDDSNGDCAEMPIKGSGSCEDLDTDPNSCAIVRSAQLEADAGVPRCPVSATDAGPQ